MEPCTQKHYVLSDVGGMSGNAFQIARNEQCVQSLTNDFRRWFMVFTSWMKHRLHPIPRRIHFEYSLCRSALPSMKDSRVAAPWHHGAPMREISMGRSTAGLFRHVHDTFGDVDA